MPRIGDLSYTDITSLTTAGYTYGQRLIIPENGWITDVGARAGGLGSSTQGRLGLYGPDKTRLRQSIEQTWDTTAAIRAFSFPAYAAAANTTFRVAWKASSSFKKPIRDSKPGELGGQYQDPTSGSALPDPFAPDTTQTLSYPTYLDYVPNATPNKGTWRASAPTGIISSTSPLFEGNTPHPAADSAYDYTSEVQLQVYRVDTGAMAYDNLFSTTQAEKNQGYFSRSPVTLAQGTTYRAKYRHRDSWGVYSEWSNEIEFTTSEIPDQPTTVSPLGKMDVVGDYSYIINYTHPNGLDCVARQIQLWNAEGTTKLDDSGEVANVNLASGSNISLAEFHTDLSWATAYKWRARTKDTANNWSAWSAFADINTNAQPGTPTEMFPADNAATEDRTFTATAVDPDGDPVTRIQMELVKSDTNVLVTGYPKELAVDSQTGAGTFTAPASDMAINTNYKWRVRATDGLGGGFGAWSGYVFFRYAEVPSVSLLAPRAPRVNLIRQPSAEYEDVSAYWTETARTATDYIDRKVDGNAAFGVAAYRSVASTGDNRLASEFHGVNAAKPYLAAMEMRKESGISVSHFSIDCYDAGGVYLGTVYPDSIAPASGTDVPESWTRYGGIIWPEGSAEAPAFPANTTQVILEWTPSRNSEAVVRGDAFQFEEVALLSATDWPNAQHWYGYTDVDEDPEDTVNTWLGDPGDSAQSFLPALLSPGRPVFISYSSSSGLAKKDDRLIIEEWQVDRYKQIYASGWQTYSRTVVPIPGGYIKNGGRYRIKVGVRDTADVVGESAYHRLDVRYDGPPELGVVLSGADPVRAELRIQFNPTTLSAEEFAGIEVAREAADGSEPLEVVDVIRDPSATETIYPYPVSGREYLLRVRQVKVVGSEQLEGRWSTAILSVDYSGYYFVKDAEDPLNLYAKYQVPRDSLQSFSTTPPEQVFLPWGATDPVTDSGIGRVREGIVEIRLLGDLEGQSLEQAFSNLRQMDQRRKTLCLLAQYPERGKTFAKVTGSMEFGSHAPKRQRVEFGWRGSSYEEDYRSRNGGSG